MGTAVSRSPMAVDRKHVRKLDSPYTSTQARAVDPEKLNNDGSAVVLTVAKYATPRGEDINGRGVTPNWTVACAPGTDAVACLDAASAAR